MDGQEMCMWLIRTTTQTVQFVGKHTRNESMSFRSTAEHVTTRHLTVCPR